MSGASATELWRMSATELARRSRGGRRPAWRSSRPTCGGSRSVNPSINAVTIVLGEQALEAAKAADRAVAAGDDLPPFHGVPFTIKDNIDLAGTPTTQGFRALAQAYPARDAPIVQRMRAAGAIPIGRTNLPTGAIRWHTRQRTVGSDGQPVGPVPDARRVQRRRGRGARDRDEPVGARQ